MVYDFKYIRTCFIVEKHLTGATLDYGTINTSSIIFVGTINSTMKLFTLRNLSRKSNTEKINFYLFNTGCNLIIKSFDI